MSLTPQTTRPTLPADKLILYVKQCAYLPTFIRPLLVFKSANVSYKASPTSAQNVVKVIMLLEALPTIPCHIYVLSSPATTPWFQAINPLQMVPAMEDVEIRDGKRLDVWESGACLLYLVERFDEGGRWGGKDAWERAKVRNWVEMHSSGLG